MNNSQRIRLRKLVERLEASKVTIAKAVQDISRIIPEIAGMEDNEQDKLDNLEQFENTEMYEKIEDSLQYLTEALDNFDKLKFEESLKFLTRFVKDLIFLRIIKLL